MARNNTRIAAGELRHRINIVTVSPVQDSTGGVDLNVDVVYANVWSKIESIGGSEAPSADAETSVTTHTITIRYIGAAPSWQPFTSYAGGVVIRDYNGYLQQALSGGGLSGGVIPSFNQTATLTTSDGDPSTGVTWRNLGLAPLQTGITAAMQVEYGPRRFQILTVDNPNERTKMLVLNCVEINDSRQQLVGPMSGIVLENGVDFIVMEDGSGFIVQEGS